MSRYVTAHSGESGEGRGWPSGYWDNVYGCLKDPDVRRPRGRGRPRRDRSVRVRGRHVFLRLRCVHRDHANTSAAGPGDHAESSPDLFGVPAIVEAELLYGAENSNNPEEGRYFVESLLSPLHIIPLRFPVRRLLRASPGRLEAARCIIGPNDLLIAATALPMARRSFRTTTRVFRRVEDCFWSCGRR